MYDVVVYGSTSGAVATAIQSSRLGSSVALVSPVEHIGIPSHLCSRLQINHFKSDKM